MMKTQSHNHLISLGLDDTSLQNREISSTFFVLTQTSFWAIVRLLSDNFCHWILDWQNKKFLQTFLQLLCICELEDKRKSELYRECWALLHTTKF